MSKIKLFDPFIDDSEKFAVNKVLDSHFWASGAGVGHVIHNQIKKNSADRQEFQDYKKMNEMPPMPPIKDNFKY